jgi:hypothetical protein
MDNKSFPRIVGVDRLDGDLILEFDNGVNALYSASLVVSILSQAVILEGIDSDEVQRGPRPYQPGPPQKQP